jgi:hypothetical protein
MLGTVGIAPGGDLSLRVPDTYTSPSRAIPGVHSPGEWLRGCHPGMARGDPGCRDPVSGWDSEPSQWCQRQSPSPASGASASPRPRPVVPAPVPVPVVPAPVPVPVPVVPAPVPAPVVPAPVPVPAVPAPVPVPVVPAPVPVPVVPAPVPVPAAVPAVPYQGVPPAPQFLPVQTGPVYQVVRPSARHLKPKWFGGARASGYMVEISSSVLDGAKAGWVPVEIVEF